MKLRFLNFTELYDEEKTVINPEALITKSNSFTEDGIFSEKIFGKLHNENFQYSCKCGNIKGKFYLCHTCPECNTEVKFTESNITRTGWLNLSNKYEFINPVFFLFIQKIIPKKILFQILSYNKKIDVNGNIIDEKDIDDEELDFEKNPFINYGLVAFKENMFKIMKFFIEKSGKNSREVKKDVYRFLKENRKYLWISKYPVTPTILRPVVIIKDSLIFDEINNCYNILISTSNMVKKSENVRDKNDLEILPQLYNIQIKLNEVFDKLLESIKGKHGFIRSNIMGRWLLM